MRPVLVLAAATATTVLLGSTAAVALDDSTGTAGTAGTATDSSGTTAAVQAPLTLIGLAGGTRLVSFSSAAPADVRQLGAVRGLDAADSRLVGIDFRAADLKLYGLGNAGGIYALSTTGGAAVKALQLSVPLEGATFAVDVNPAADALRVVSDTGQNLRQSFATPGPTSVDVRLSTPPTVGDTLGVAGAAYTNNDLDPATGTLLYDISTVTDSVLVQAPANSGTLTQTGTLRVDASGEVGFDIASTVRGGTTTALRAYASLSVGGQRGLYDVKLFSGKADRVGRLGEQVTDIAIPLGQ